MGYFKITLLVLIEIYVMLGVGFLFASQPFLGFKG